MREFHGIHVEVHYEVVGSDDWQYVFHIKDGETLHIDQMSNHRDYSNTYEEALEIGLQKALILI